MSVSFRAIILTLFLLPLQAQAFDHSHSRLDEILAAHVESGLVDYFALSKDRAKLKDYLSLSGKVSAQNFASWSEGQQLAFLVNLYNAATLELILEHYPVKGIKKIGSWFSTPWKIEFIELFGKKQSLDYIEHGLLRENYTEPRIHFALVCAAMSCPPLRSEAYKAERLSEQFEAQGRQFLSDTSKNRYDGASRTIEISKIFSWFREDFGTDQESLKDFVLPYFPKSTQEQINSDRAQSLRFLSYDWSLNEQ